MRIHVVPGGPLLVEGMPVGALRRDGERYVVDPIASADPCALCRCGRSSAMPFCDHEAPYACFEEEPADGPEPAPFRWDVPDPDGRPSIALKPDGPLRVAGGAAVPLRGAAAPPPPPRAPRRCGGARG